MQTADCNGSTGFLERIKIKSKDEKTVFAVLY
jgi:hypothetical protein